MKNFKKGYKLKGLLKGESKKVILGTFTSTKALNKVMREYNSVFGGKDCISFEIKIIRLIPAEKYEVIISLLMGL